MHARHVLGRETEACLAAPGDLLAPPSEEEARLIAADRAARLKRRLLIGLVAVVVAAVAGGSVQWFRPLPSPMLTGVARTILVPGPTRRLRAKRR